MRSRRCIFALFFHVVCSVAADDHCGLNCDHGTCTLVSNKQEELTAMVQSGKMIERCACEEGYGGTACDVQVDPCQSNGKCSNGRACQRVKETGEYTCECSDAEGVSKFAGLMCRNPYTEYCADKYNPNEPTSFCTNGGKCKSSFVSAQVAPGNTTINNEYRHLGCVCPKEFDGPHCEILKYERPISHEADGEPDTATNSDTNTADKQETDTNEGYIDEPVGEVQARDPEGKTKQPNILMIVGLSCLAAFALLFVLFGMKRRKTRQTQFHMATMGHAYPQEYADGTLSYAESDLYPQELRSIPAMSGRGSSYSDSSYIVGNPRADTGFYREDDGLERSSAYRSTRRINPPLYVDFETSTRSNDRRYSGYHEDDQAPTDWASSGASHNTMPWGNNTHAHGYHVQ